MHRTIDNLLIGRMVSQDAHRCKRNLCMARVDVAKAYDLVDPRWLAEMFRFPEWFDLVMEKYAASWNTKIVITTERSREVSDVMRLKRGLPQGDALCPTLFTLCVNPIA